MALNYPERPTANTFQFLGQALTQGGGVADKLGGDLLEQQKTSNLLADMVDARIARKKEQERADWEYTQLKDKDTKEEAARKEINGLLTDGVKVPGVTSIIPPKTETLQGPIAPADEIPTPMANYHNPYEVTTPGRTESTTDSYRPATTSDYQRAALPTEDPATFVKNLVPPNKAAALMAVKTFILGAKAAGNKIIKGSDLDIAALSGDPTGAILTDKEFNNFKKLYATDVQTQNAETGVVNSQTSQKRAEIAQQNADIYAKKVAQNKPIDATDTTQMGMLADDLATGKLRIEKLPYLLGRGSQNTDTRLKLYAMARDRNPNFDPSETEKSFKMYDNAANQRTVAAIDNVKSRMARVEELSNSIDRTRFPTLNAYLLSGERAAGNMKATLLQLNEDLMGEELTPVFGQGSAGSNAKLELAQKISDLGKLPIDVAAAKIQELKGALDTRKATFTKTMGIYGEKMDGGGASPIKSSSGKTSVVFH